MTSSPSEDLVPIERLTGFMETIPELAPLLPIASVQRVGHGQSNLTFRLSLTGGTLILRRPPAGPIPPKAHDVLREYRIMHGLYGSAVPVPRPLAACDDIAVLGAPFFLMEHLQGDAVVYRLPPPMEASADAPRLLANGAIDCLAALHMTDPATVGLADLGRPTGYVKRQLRTWTGQLEYARVRPVPDLDWAAAWLEEHQPPDVARSSIVHGDYRLDNVLFSVDAEPRPLGVVDWELSTLGDPLSDLGWLLAFWCQDGTPPAVLTFLPRVMESPRFPRRSDLVRRYADRTGQDVPDLRFYVVFALWRMAVLLEGHWARYTRGSAGVFDFAYLETAGPIFASYIRSVAEGM